MSMTTAIERQEDGTIKLTVTIPAASVQKTREEVLQETAKQAAVPGFRKGKAPQKLVEEKADEGKIKEEILKKLLPLSYIDAVKEHNLKPIVSPKIHVESIDDGKDWQFVALTCEMPDVDLGSYKDNIQKITAKSKIVLPGKEPTPVKFDDIVKTLLETAKVTIPSILTTGEVDRLLAQLLDDIKKLGLSLDQYLASTGKTAEQLRADYEAKAKNDISLEFILQKVAENEKITVEDKEIDEAIQKAKDDTERKNLEANKYMLASILRQQKTLDFLKNL